MGERDASVWTSASAFHLASASFYASFSVSKTRVPQSLSFSKRRATDALVSCQTKKVRMNTGRPSVKAVPEAVRNKPTPESAPFKAVLECVRNRALLQKERHHAREADEASTAVRIAT